MHKSLCLFLFLLVTAGMINISLWDENSDDDIHFTIMGENLSVDAYADMNKTFSAVYLTNVSRMDEYILHSDGGYCAATENLTT